MGVLNSLGFTGGFSAMCAFTAAAISMRMKKLSKLRPGTGIRPLGSMGINGTARMKIGIILSGSTAKYQRKSSSRGPIKM